MTVTLPLDEMTIEDKISTMEILWNDISKVPEDYKSPAWHSEILKQRKENLASGKDGFQDWEDVKREIWDNVK